MVLDTLGCTVMSMLQVHRKEHALTVGTCPTTVLLPAWDVGCVAVKVYDYELHCAKYMACRPVCYLAG